MEVIKERFRGDIDPEKIVLAVLRDWVQGKGVELSWKSLIATLRDCKISLLATQIEMALDSPVECVSV